MTPSLVIVATTFLLCVLLFSGCSNAKGTAKVRPPGLRNNERQKPKSTSSDSSSDSSSDNSESEAADAREQSINDLSMYLFRNSTHEERLLAYLFRDYDPVARAVMDTDKPVAVSIDFVLLRIHGLDERSQVLTTTGLVIAEWTDERLVWDPMKFGNLTDIILKADKIWLPELAVMNGAEELMPDFERIRVLLHSTGKLHWEPGGIFRTTCDIDIGYFPFDAQHCPLLIGSYSYYSTRMNISNASSIIWTQDFRVNGEWEVTGTAAEWGITHLDCCSGNGYSHVVFTLHLKRRYKFYIMNIVLPCVMLSVLIMIGFCLPPEAGEKISLGISVLLAFTVFLLMIADNIPRTSSAIPLIVTYLMATMTLGTMSICMTVLILNVHHRGPRYQMPGWLRRLCFRYIARLICIQTPYGGGSGGLHMRPCSANHHGSTWRKQTHSSPHEAPPSSDPEANGRGAKTDPDPGLDQLEAGQGQTTTGPLVAASNCPNISVACGVPLLRHIRRRRIFSRRPLDGGGSHHPLASSGSRDGGYTPHKDSVKEWHELARVLDRLFFWLLFTMMTLSAVCILLYPKYTGTEDG